jgi:hypothetical protein
VEFRAAAPAGERILYASGPQDQQPRPSPDRQLPIEVRCRRATTLICFTR